AIFQAFDPAREFKVCPQRNDFVADGKPLDPKVPGGSDLSTELMRRIGVKVGQAAALLTNDKDGVLNAAEVPIVGSLDMGGIPLFEKKLLFLPLATAQELLRMEGRSTEIAVA